MIELEEEYKKTQAVSLFQSQHLHHVRLHYTHLHPLLRLSGSM